MLGRGSNFRVIIIFSIIFSSSKCYAMHVLCTPRKAEIMFFKLIFCLRKIRKKGFSLSEKYYFFPAQKLIKILLFLGPMHTQEARNNVFQDNFLLAGNSEERLFAVEKVFSSSKISSFSSISMAYAHPKKAEIMFSN